MKTIEHHRIQTGGNIVEIVGKLAYDNAKKCFEEMVSNGYDADASKVDVRIYKNHVDIEDDGSGMNSKDLDDYLRIGGSVKWDQHKQLEKTPQFGREPIGRFGLGKFSLYMLCDSYTIETCKNGEKRTFTFDYRELVKHQSLDDYIVDTIVEKCPREWHGTKVTMHGLKKDINVKDIYEILGDTMPIEPNFEMTMHTNIKKYKAYRGKRIVPKKLAKGKRTNFNQFLTQHGQISGYITLTSSPLKDGQDGIYIRVRGRKRGDKHTIDLDKVGGVNMIKKRIYGEFDADCLRNLVKIDSGGFYKDSATFKAVENYILGCVKDIVKQYNMQRREQRTKDVAKVIENVVEDLRVAFDSEKLKDLFRGKKKKKDGKEKNTEKKKDKDKQKKDDKEKKKRERKKKELGDNEFTLGSIDFDIEQRPYGEDGLPVYIEQNGHRTKRKIVLNNNHPSFEYSHKQGKPALEIFIKQAICWEASRYCVAHDEEMDLDDMVDLHDELLRSSIRMEN